MKLTFSTLDVVTLARLLASMAALGSSGTAAAALLRDFFFSLPAAASFAGDLELDRFFVAA